MGGGGCERALHGLPSFVIHFLAMVPQHAHTERDTYICMHMYLHQGLTTTARPTVLPLGLVATTTPAARGHQQIINKQAGNLLEECMLHCIYIYYL